MQIMENSNQNITCVCVCARAHECVCVCVCVSYLGSEEEDGKDEGLWGVNSEMAYSPLFLSVEQSWFFFFFWLSTSQGGWAPALLSSRHTICCVTNSHQW